MTKAAIVEAGLFTNEELEGIQPTGSPWVVSDDDPATVPVPLQTVIVSVDGPYTERDRKLWVFLLHAVFEELGKEPLHTLSVREINSVFRELGGDHGTQWLWESAKRLAKTTIEWEYTLGDDRVQGVASLFSAEVHKAARSTGKLRFGFPPLLIPILKEPSRFARLRVHFLLKLSGKYAVTLYEILEGFVNRRDGQCRVSIEDLRTWLKVPVGTYPSWKDFRKWVLDPAIKQINDDPLGAGFSVEYEPIRKGRFYDEIVFKLTKTAKRIAIDNTIKTNAKTGRTVREAQAAGRPLLRSAAIEKAAHETRHFLDMEVIERDFWAFWETSGRKPFQKGADAAFIGFAKKKYGQLKYGKK